MNLTADLALDTDAGTAARPSSVDQDISVPVTNVESKADPNSLDAEDTPRG